VDTGAENFAAGPVSVDETASDRRSHERFVTVFRLAKLIGGREEFCLVRNVSAGGLKAQAFSPKAVDDRLAVDFGDEQLLPARVAWVDDDNIGITFDDQIDVARMLSKAPPPGRSRARPLRLTIELDMLVTIGKSEETCHLIDISQGGAKLEMSSAPNPGDRITLEIEGLGKLSCVVRWTRKGNVGVAFPGQLPYRQLAAWVGSLSRAAA
jgi:PilZ domain-containing protein